MAKLTFPISQGALLVDVLVGLDGATTATRLATGQSVTPIRTRGEIDTGSNVPGVSAAILRRVGVPIQYATTTQTASGIAAVDVFKVSLSVRDLRDPTGPALVEAMLTVMELPTTLPAIEVLIGLDFLLGYRFCLNGPAREFSLEF